MNGAHDIGKPDCTIESGETDVVDGRPDRHRSIADAKSVGLVYSGGSGETLLRSSSSPWGFDYVFPSYDPNEVINLPPPFPAPGEYGDLAWQFPSEAFSTITLRRICDCMAVPEPASPADLRPDQRQARRTSRRHEFDDHPATSPRSSSATASTTSARSTTHSRSRGAAPSPSSTATSAAPAGSRCRSTPRSTGRGRSPRRSRSRRTGDPGTCRSRPAASTSTSRASPCAGTPSSWSRGATCASRTSAPPASTSTAPGTRRRATGCSSSGSRRPWT